MNFKTFRKFNLGIPNNNFEIEVSLNSLKILVNYTLGRLKNILPQNIIDVNDNLLINLQLPKHLQ